MQIFFRSCKSYGKGGIFMAIRTDLALEAKQLWEQSAARTTKLQGVRARTLQVGESELTQVDILDERGQQALGKPIGRYTTLELPRSRCIRASAEALAGEVRHMAGENGCVLVVGLGNAAVTPDALGPLTVRRLFLTRHLREHLPEQFGAFRPVCAVCPGVLATTGIESAELVRGAIAHVKPSCVIVIDALATGSMERLCRTVQLTDTGIVPGSGVGNRRSGFSRQTLGVPVLALGAATVTDASTQSIVTPRDIDEQVRYLAAVLAGAVNLALHPELSYDELMQFVPNC